ncbi:MAG TPA: SDR family NAD(P)-dependent oxidoreductase [Lacipirellulaceae bacterium]|nr:SDR family NAD(P)-dependent oxidoreductase [Lacipirellulaceae bacterium]
MKKILITGGAGFVGSHLADALLKQGHEVRVFDNLSPQVHERGLPDYLAGEAHFVHGDLRDIDAVRDAVRDIEAIFHFGAAVGVGQSMYEIAHYIGVNTQGTANLLQAVLDAGSKIEKLVVASSMSIYGEGRYLCVECGEVTPNERTQTQLKEKLWEPVCPQCGRDLAPVPTDEAKPLNVSSYYALSKKDQEEMVLLFGRTYGLPAVALRFFNIYGTRQALSNPYTGVAAIFASRLLNDRAPLVFEDGRQMRDFVSVHDIVRANLLALEKDAANGMALNVGSGEPISVREVASALAVALGAEIAPELTGKYRAGDIRHCFADISRAREVLGYEPRVKFADGVRELVAWLREQQAEDRVAEAAEKLSVYGLTA